MGDDQPGPHPAALKRRTPRRTALWVFGAGAAVAVIALGASTALVTSLSSAQQRAERVTRDDLTIQRQSAEVRRSAGRWQAFLEPRLDTNPVGARVEPADIAAGSTILAALNRQAAVLAHSLRVRGFSNRATELDAASKAFNEAIEGLSPIAAGDGGSAREIELVVRSERDAQVRLSELVSSIERDVALRATNPDVDFVTQQIDAARRLCVWMGAALALAALAIGGLAARRAARRQQVRDEEAGRRHYETEVYQAIDLATTEDAVYDVVGRTLRDTVPDLDVELLIADSSHAHFQRALTSHPAGAAGCGVVSPGDCPATVRGHTMQFPSSEAISACPYLRDRPTGPCSAVCIPVGIAGSTVGVMHATGPDGALPGADDIESMELSARHASERIALLRAFANSETQAHTDPLTGLLNRRSLENHVRELHRDNEPYTLAYGDLDHFKVLNDTHGHESGDRALRLFARVLRDSVRPADIVSRYGGEEFVVVLPDCDTERATAVLERVRENLALALTHGGVPAFTVSFGVATSDDGNTFDEIAACADAALLAAKASGRNRVLIAGEPVPTADQWDAASAPNSIVST